MKYLFLVALLLSPSAFADPFNYIAKKAVSNPALTVLENTPDHITVRDKYGVQFAVSRQDVNTFIADTKANAGETDLIAEAVFEGRDLTTIGDLRAQRIVLKGVRVICGAAGAACGIMAGSTAPLLLPILVGSACIGVSAECFLDGDVILALRAAAKSEGMKYQPYLNKLLRRVVLGESSSLEDRVAKIEEVLKMKHRAG